MPRISFWPSACWKLKAITGVSIVFFRTYFTWNATSCHIIKSAKYLPSWRRHCPSPDLEQSAPFPPAHKDVAKWGLELTFLTIHDERSLEEFRHTTLGIFRTMAVSQSRMSTGYKSKPQFLGSGIVWRAITTFYVIKRTELNNRVIADASQSAYAPNWGIAQPQHRRLN